MPRIERGCRAQPGRPLANLWRSFVRPINRSAQGGVSILGFLLFGGLAVLIAIEAARAYPSFLEFYQIERAIVSATQRGNTPAEVRKFFDNSAIIDNISAVSGQDLDIEKVGNGYVASVSYLAWINLFKNVNLVIEFSASSQPTLGGAPGKGRTAAE